jgi:transketolase
LRLIPNLDVWRPADLTETACAWISALQEAGRPSALVLSRQNLPAQPRSPGQLMAVKRGGYVLKEEADAQLTLLATGSEVQLAMSVLGVLALAGVKARVVSMPCTNVFDRQPSDWKQDVLGDLPRFAIEAGVTLFWAHYRCQKVYGVDQYGESAPAAQVFAHFGLTPDAIARDIQDNLPGAAK